MGFDLIKSAQLTQREFADFCGVSRCTVNLWVRGSMRPHRYIRDDINMRLESIKGALAAGLLPAKHAKGPERAEELKLALQVPQT